MENQIQSIVKSQNSTFFYSKFNTWCTHCSKLKRLEKKKKFEEEIERQREKDIVEQERKLEEARKEMMKEQQTQFADYNRLFHTWPNSYYIYSQSNNGLNDETINLLAQEKAQKEFTGAISYEDLFLLHKILITSKEMLLTKL